MNYKKLVSMLLVLAAVVLAAGCTGADDLLGGGELVITDSAGEQVILEEQPDRVAIAGKATVMVQDTVYLFEEAEERVVALENRRQSAYGFLPLVDPDFETKQLLEMNSGAEQIAAVNPDLVIMKNFMAESLGASLETLDIPVLYLDLETPDAFYKDIRALGEVFGSQERAEEIIDFYQTRVEKVEVLAGDIPADQKPSVLILEYSDRGGETAFSVPPVSWLQTRMVEIAGGNPVWTDLEASGGWTVVTLDQIASWDPDQIYLIDYQGEAAEVAVELYDADIWSELDAVQNDRFYAFAFDFYSWDQPDTRWILGLQWLATRIHPELQGNIDIQTEIFEFYQTLYRMEEDQVQEEVLPLLRGDVP